MSNIIIVRSNSIIHNEAEDVKMREIDTPKAAELFNRAGLWLLVKSLSYFGFKISENPRNHCCVNRPYAAFLFTTTFTAFASNCYIMYPLIINSDGSFDIESAGFYMLMAGGYLIAIFIYFFGVINARNYNILFNSLASAVDQVNDSECRQKFVRSVKHTVFLWSVPCFTITILLAFSTFYQGEHWLDDQGKILTITSPIFSIFFKMLNLVWFATIGQFYFFTSIYLSITCKMMNFLLQIYLGPNDNGGERAVRNIWNDLKQLEEVRVDEMRKNVINHRKLSQIMEQANSAFTHFLLFTLTLEISVCISFVKLLTMKNGIYSVMAYAYIFHIAMMLWKVFICGNVNEKLKKSLNLKKLPNFYQYSNEQVSYLLYLEEQNINRAEITYGNLFPIRKTFVFTILGTVLTYALVLNEIFKDWIWKRPPKVKLCSLINEGLIFRDKKMFIHIVVRTFTTCTLVLNGISI